MAQIQIPNLPVAIAIDGTEELEIVQAGTSHRTTTGMIASFLAGVPGPTGPEGPTGSVSAITAYTVATLPGAPTPGTIARVTDALTPAIGSTVVSGGAAQALCWYNGANWTVIGV